MIKFISSFKILFGILRINRYDSQLCKRFTGTILNDKIRGTLDSLRNSCLGISEKSFRIVLYEHELRSEKWIFLFTGRNLPIEEWKTFRKTLRRWMWKTRSKCEPLFTSLTWTVGEQRVPTISHRSLSGKWVLGHDTYCPATRRDRVITQEPETTKSIPLQNDRGLEDNHYK